MFVKLNNRHDVQQLEAGHVALRDIIPSNESTQSKVTNIDASGIRERERNSHFYVEAEQKSFVKYLQDDAVRPDVGSRRRRYRSARLSFCL